VLYAGSNLGKAQQIFAQAVKHRPRIKLTIRQRTRVLREWPPKLFDNQTLFSLGLISGTTFTWSWNDPNSFGIKVGIPTATPLPAALPLFAIGLSALGLLGWRRKRKAAIAAA
jgi:hypothetical protein